MQFPPLSFLSSDPKDKHALDESFSILEFQNIIKSLKSNTDFLS